MGSALVSVPRSVVQGDPVILAYGPVVGAVLAVAVPGLTPRAEPKGLVGGELAEEGEYPEVVSLTTNRGSCSAVMVSSTILLTAAHCLTQLDPTRSSTAYFGVEIDYERRRQVRRLGIFPSYCPDCREDWSDIGYAELTLPYELEGDSYAVPIVTQSEWDEAMQPGRAMTAVGFGTPVGTRLRQTHGPMNLDEVSPSGREITMRKGRVSAIDGDSGGAVFVVLAGGERRLVGIHSRGVGRDRVSVATTPYPHLCWLRDETGLDLLEEGDDRCYGLDIGGGCSIGDRSGPRWSWWLPVLLLIGRRRRPRAEDLVRSLTAAPR